MDACPNYKSESWSNLLANLKGDSGEAHRIFLAHEKNLPNIKKLVDIKSDLKFRGGPLSGLSKAKMLVRLSSYNKRNNSSHNILFTEVSPTSFKAKLNLNFMPKFDIQYSSKNLKEVAKLDAEVSVFTTLSPDDIVSREGNEYTVGGEVYASYEDAVNATYLQLSKESKRKPNEALDDYLKTFLSEYGISVNQIDNFKERYGFKGIAASEIANKVINVAKGKADIRTLPEEAGHFVVEMMGEDNVLYQAMLKDIKTTAEYQKVVKEYGKVYNNDETRLAKEAIGKVLAKYIIKESENREELSPKTNSLLDRLVKWIKSFFKKMDNSFLTEQLNPAFENVAKAILNKDVKLGLSKDRLEGSKHIYYELSNSISDLETALEKLNHRINDLESKARTESSSLAVNALKIRVDVIKKLVDSKEIELGYKKFLEYINNNEIENIYNMALQFEENPSELEHGSAFIREMSDSTTLYKGLVRDIERSIRDNNDYPGLYKDGKVIIRDIESKVIDIEKFLSDIKRKRLNIVINDYKAKGSKYDINDLITSVEGDSNALSRYLGPLHASKDEVLRMIHKKIFDIYNEAFLEALEDGNSMKDVQLAMEKAGFKDLSAFHEKDSNGKSTGFLISEHKWGEYNQEYSKVLDDIAKAAGKDDYGNVIKEELTKEQRLEYDRLWAKFNKKYKKFEASDNGMVLVPNPPKNEKFLEMMKTPTIKAYYDEVRKVHEKSKHKLVRKYNDERHYFMLPQMRKDIMQTLLNSKTGVFKHLTSRFKESFKITVDDTDFGDLNKDVMLDVNGEAIKLVPIHYVSRVENTDDLSNDITSMYAAFSEMANKFDGITRNIDDIMLIKEAIGERRVKTKNDVKKGSESYTYKALDDFIDMNVHGRRKNIVLVKFLGKEWNITKIFDKLITWTREKNLFLNIFTTLSGYGKASIDSKLDDITGLYTSQESKNWAEGEFDKNVANMLANVNNRKKFTKMELVFERNRVFKGMSELFDRMDIDNRLLRTSWSDIIYSSYQLFDVRVKGKLTLAIYNNFRLVNGQFIRKSEFDRLTGNNGKWSDYKNKTLYDAYETNGSNLVIKPEYKEYITKELENNVAGIIQYRTSTVDGMINELDRGSINKHILGRALMLHRNWLVSGTIERFKSEGINYLTGEEEEGYYISAKKAVANILRTEGGIRQKIGMYSQLSEIEKRGLRRMVSDLAFTAGLVVINYLIQSIADDDDEDEWYLQALGYQSTRILLEQTAFQNPTEILNILNSPSALTNTVEGAKDLLKSFVDWEPISSGPYKDKYRVQQMLMKNSLLKNLYEMQYPKDKNKYIRTTMF